jgi:hypothetical protein
MSPLSVWSISRAQTVPQYSRLWTVSPKHLACLFSWDCAPVDRAPVYCCAGWFLPPLWCSAANRTPPRLLSAYFGLCIFAGILSKYELFLTSWQTQFMAEAIVRQLVPLLGFFAVAWASKAYFRQKFQNGEDVFSGAPGFIVLSLFIAPAIMFQQGVGYQGDYSIFAIIGLYGSLINNTLVGYFFVLGYIFLTRDWRRYAGIITILGVTLEHFQNEPPYPAARR